MFFFFFFVSTPEKNVSCFFSLFVTVTTFGSYLWLYFQWLLAINSFLELYIYICICMFHMYTHIHMYMKQISYAVSIFPLYLGTWKHAGDSDESCNRLERNLSVTFNMLINNRLISASCSEWSPGCVSFFSFRCIIRSKCGGWVIA